VGRSGAVECCQDVHAAYNERIDPAYESMIGTGLTRAWRLSIATREAASS
jgi:hypothetical protein